jgi:hypothetical protein
MGRDYFGGLVTRLRQRTHSQRHRMRTTGITGLSCARQRLLSALAFSVCTASAIRHASHTNVVGVRYECCVTELPVVRATSSRFCASRFITAGRGGREHDDPPVLTLYW